LPRARERFALEFERMAPGGAPEPLACTTRMQAPIDDEEAAAVYRRGFTRIQEAIRAGEIYQANLSRRIDLPFGDDAADAYASLRRRQPVPQGAYLDLGTRQVLSNSPECFLRARGPTIETFPIKGTRARHPDPRRDRLAAVELARDEKERAEHVMIVDLERNDLGRVCRAGAVSVPMHARVESYATVHHLVSVVRGELSVEATLADILRATFPGGSITGAPKIRAMQILAEVEPRARGIYTGAIGSFNGARSLELNVAIRTAIAGSGRIHYCTGGGIVADSVMAAEWEETRIKARAFLDAVFPRAERASATL
jgi:para-aminobenzoate synthetase component 1